MTSQKENTIFFFFFFFLRKTNICIIKRIKKGLSARASKSARPNSIVLTLFKTHVTNFGLSSVKQQKLHGILRLASSPSMCKVNKQIKKKINKSLVSYQKKKKKVQLDILGILNSVYKIQNSDLQLIINYFINTYFKLKTQFSNRLYKNTKYIYTERERESLFRM